MAGCGNPVTINYSFIYQDEGPNEKIAKTMKAFLEREFNVEIELVKSSSSYANLDSLAGNKIDMGLIENYVPYQNGINSAFIFYDKILHIFYKGDQPTTFRELIYGRRVFVDAQNSPSYDVMMDLFEFYQIDQDQVDVAVNMSDAEVVMRLSTLLADEELQYFSDFKLYSLDKIHDYRIGGSSVEGISLKYPRIRPYVIPKGMYSNLTTDPVITISIDVVMMVRSGMRSIAVRDLTQTILRNPQTFTAIDPQLGAELKEGFDRGKLTFPLHEGAREFLDRDEPGFFERYAELAGVTFSIVIAIIGGIISITRWQAQKKKDKVDEFYKDLLKIKNVIPSIKEVDEGRKYIQNIQGSQNRAFKMLTSEELIPNDSFRIYMELSKETIGELRNKIRLIKNLKAKSES